MSMDPRWEKYYWCEISMVLDRNYLRLSHILSSMIKFTELSRVLQRTFYAFMI